MDTDNIMDEPGTSQKCESTNYTILPSQRGGDLLLLKGYRYSKRRINNNDHIVWRCTKRKICNASLVTNNGLVVKQEDHKCQPNEGENEVKKRVNKCIQKAKNEITPIPTIYAETVEEYNDTGFDIISKMPSYEVLKKTLYRHRHSALKAKVTKFTKAKNVKIPGIFEKFLLADYCEKNNRILVFASPKARLVLKTAKHVFCDGTFKCCSPPFNQLYTIHADIGSTNETNNIVPAAYALLDNKKQETYEILLQLIKSQISGFSPEIFTTDYEASAMLAISAVFPGSKINGCLFHFARALWRKTERTGMKKKA